MPSPRTVSVAMFLTVLALLLGRVTILRAADGPIDFQGLAARATSTDAANAKAAIAELRAAGPAGLRALIDANADAIRWRTAASTDLQSAPNDETWRRISAAIDAVAAQKDAYTSGLYWYTNLDDARHAAKASGKPILSLRLLGTLDTEFSCANSRFFRTALYANREVSAALSERFVLHWKSVRPVPKVTIDFGDGRVVERTITGNSIHYVLDADGNVVDAIPGLYGPRAFLEKLNEAAVVEKGTRTLAAADRDHFRRNWHAGKADEALRAWQADLQRAGVPVAPPAVTAGAADAQLASQLLVADLADGQPPAGGPPRAEEAGLRAKTKAAPQMPLVRALAVTPKPANAGVAPPPPAMKAAPLARSKAFVEARLVKALTPAPDAGALAAAGDDAAWQKVAALHAEEARLDESSRALIAAKNPAAVEATAEMANILADSKAKVETPLLKMVRNFERSVAEDTVRNDYTFHRTIHTWLAGAAKEGDANFAKDVNALNERVYAELFLTPSSDPWLGLLPPDTYTALEGDGLCPAK